MRTRTDPRPSATVAIIASNPETLDGLQAYLSAAGLHARGTRDLDECSRAAHARTRAFIVFPDDFAWEQVMAAIADLRQRRPSALPMLVTAHPKRFAELTQGDKVLVVPRPAWGWTILEAIRAHLEGIPSSAPTPGGHP